MILDIPVSNNPYPVYIGEELLIKAGSILKDWQGKKAAIITDTKVEKLYLEKLIKNLNFSGIDAKAFSIPEGEKSKNPFQLLALYDDLIDAKIDRKDVVIALGGGVVGDLAGFLAATYLRGIDFIQIPTTLLAQVDSSVGGKVAVDLEKGKNLIGSFYHPRLVIADTGTLKTLEPRHLSAGLAEVVKYACIKDVILYEKLAAIKGFNDVWLIMDEIIERSIKVKRDYILRDPLDKGPRMELNFGHTLGHALETALGYENILHGEGVALGMLEATAFSEALGITKNGTYDKLKELLKKLKLPIQLTQNIDKIKVEEAILRDKKAAGNIINMIFIEDIGRAMIKPVNKEEIASLVRGI